MRTFSAKHRKRAASGTGSPTKKKQAGMFLRVLTIALSLGSLAAKDAYAVVCPGNWYYTDAVERGCTSIGKDLEIDGGGFSYEVTNVDGLSGLTSIGGDLIIWTHRNLMNVNGFSALTSVGGRIVIHEASALTNVDGLSGITSVDKVQIDQNRALTNLDGLSSLTSANEIYIGYNDSLTNIDGLSSLTSVGGTLGIFSGEESSATALANVDGLSGLTSVGFLALRTGSSVNLDSLAGLTSAAGIYIYGPFLTNIDGLSGITFVGGGDACREAGLVSTNSRAPWKHHHRRCGHVEINGTSALTNIDGLSSLTSANNVVLHDNEALTNLDGLSSLTSLGAECGGAHRCGRVEISDNDALTNVDGLSSLTSIVELQIRSNAALTNIDGLSALTSVDDNVWVYGNQALTNLDGFSALTSVGGECTVRTSRCGFFQINENQALTNVDGLSALASVNRLRIVDNPSLCQGTMGELLSGIRTVVAQGNDDSCTQFCADNAGSPCCLDGAWLDCSDSDLCTRDFCHPTLGCQNSTGPLAACIDDWARGSIVVKEARAGKERFFAKLEGSSEFLEFGHPGAYAARTNFAACLYDDEGTLVESLDLDSEGDDCPGRGCWDGFSLPTTAPWCYYLGYQLCGHDPSDSYGWVYRDATASSDGLSLVKLAAGKRTQILLKGANNGRKGRLALPTGIAAGLLDSESVTIQLVGSEAGGGGYEGMCFSMTLDEIKKQEADRFKALKR